MSRPDNSAQMMSRIKKIHDDNINKPNYSFVRDFVRKYYTDRNNKIFKVITNGNLSHDSLVRSVIRPYYNGMLKKVQKSETALRQLYDAYNLLGLSNIGLNTLQEELKTRFSFENPDPLGLMEMKKMGDTTIYGILLNHLSYVITGESLIKGFNKYCEEYKATRTVQNGLANADKIKRMYYVGYDGDDDDNYTKRGPNIYLAHDVELFMFKHPVVVTSIVEDIMLNSSINLRSMELDYIKKQSQKIHKTDKKKRQQGRRDSGYDTGHVTHHDRERAKRAVHGVGSYPNNMRGGYGRGRGRGKGRPTRGRESRGSRGRQSDKQEKDGKKGQKKDGKLVGLIQQIYNNVLLNQITNNNKSNCTKERQNMSLYNLLNGDIVRDRTRYKDISTKNTPSNYISLLRDEDFSKSKMSKMSKDGRKTELDFKHINLLTSLCGSSSKDFQNIQQKVVIYLICLYYESISGIKKSLTQLEGKISKNNINIVIPPNTARTLNEINFFSNKTKVNNNNNANMEKKINAMISNKTTQVGKISKKLKKMALETNDVSKLKRIEEAERKLRSVARKKIQSDEKKQNRRSSET